MGATRRFIPRAPWLPPVTNTVSCPSAFSTACARANAAKTLRRTGNPVCTHRAHGSLAALSGKLVATASTRRWRESQRTALPGRLFASCSTTGIFSIRAATTGAKEV